MIDINMTLAAQILNFLVLVAILRAVAYKPVKKMLAERSAKIQESLEKADADKAAAQRLLADYKAKLEEAREKAASIVESAERVAAQNRDASIESTKREVEQMKEAARAEIARDRARAKDEIRKEIVALSLLAAGKIVTKNMTTSDNEALVEGFIDTLDKDKIGELPC